MQQENKTESDNSVSEFAKTRIQREKARLEAVSRDSGEPLPYTPLPNDFYIPTEEDSERVQKVKNRSAEPTSEENSRYVNRKQKPQDIHSTFDSHTAFETKRTEEATEIIDYEKATDKQKAAYDAIMAHGKAADETVRIAQNKPRRGKPVIINPKWEHRRNLTVKHSRRIILIATLSVAVVALRIGMQQFSHSRFFDRLQYAFQYDADNAADGMNFEPIDGYVTVGDSVERATELLGEPDFIESNFYYYGKSYLIFEEDKVVGYYRAPDDAIPVSVGQRGKNPSGRVMVGDSMKNVIYLLGSPEFCFGKNWLYLSCNGLADPDGTPKEDFEVQFDDDGRVLACFSVKR